MAEVRRIYSLHSFRVTATNLLMAAGAPPHLRKILGRWSSDSGMETYTREEIEKEDEYSEESEEEMSRDFFIPKDMQILPRPSKLDKEMVGLLITKHFGDFGWGQGKIKGYNSRRKFPFEIKWSDEPKSRFHQLTLDEYMEEGKEREAKAGDFTMFVKAKQKR